MDFKFIVVILGLVAAASCGKSNNNYNYNYSWDPCNPNPCGDPEARCKKTGNNLSDYKCICPAGKKYNPNSFSCAGPCSNDPCGSAKCVAYGSSYKCHCPTGKYYDKQNQYCKGPCDNFPCGYVKCQPTGPTSYKCVCPIGKKFDIINQNCKPIPNDKNANFGDSGIIKGYSNRRKFQKLLRGIADKGYWYKCVTGSKNGFSASTFHQRCDKKGPTITVVKSGNHVFGGYTDKSWNGNAGYIRSLNGLLWSLNHDSKVYSNRRPQYSIYSNNGYLPTFGGGNDLYLASNGNGNTNSYSNYGHSYSSVQTYGSTAAKSFLAGGYKFRISDYEVYYQLKNPCKEICGKAQCVMENRRPKCYCNFGKFNKAIKQCQLPIQNGNFKKAAVFKNKDDSLRQNLLHMLKGIGALKGYWYRCYQASEHGFSSAAFHRHCDNKGATVTLVRVGGKVFGGYTPVSWNANKGYIRTNKAMLFSLNSYKTFRSTKYPQYGTYSNNGYGPTFGAGHDLYIANNCRNSKSSYSNLGHSYYTTSPYTYGSTAAKSILAGSYQFYVNEYETYYVVKNPCKVQCGTAQCQMINHAPKCFCNFGEKFNRHVKACQAPIISGNFKNSAVLANQGESTRQNLLHILKKVTGQGYWYRCYKGSNHGFSSNAFHRGCDKKGPTVILARSGGDVFGGYTPVSFNGNKGYIRTNQAMLFNVKKYRIFKSTKYPQYGIYSNMGYGPTFGAGHDLYICNNAQKSRSSYSNLGHSYYTQKPYTYGSTAAKSILAGSYNFYTNEYEGYYLLKNPCKSVCGSAYCNMVNYAPKCSCDAGSRFNSVTKSCQSAIETSNFLDSKVLKNQGREVRQKLLHILKKVASGYWYKCYTGSKYGFSASQFHSHCDNKGATVTIVRSGNHIFGGYTPVSFNANKGYIRTDKAMLFNVKKYWTARSTKYPQYGIYSNLGYGPTFGAGHDLYIVNNCRNSKSSYSNLGHSYRTSSPYTYGSTAAKSILAGSYNFYCNEYETYYLVKNPCKETCGDAQCQMYNRKPKCYCNDFGKTFNYAIKKCQAPIQSGNFIKSKVLANQGKSVRQNLLHILQSVAPNGYWYKCYTGSENGFSSSQFHSKCDNKGETVTIVRAGDNVFGGYTPIPWNAAKGYQRSSKSMLFNVKKYITFKSTKYPQYSTYSNNGYGPTFGAGNDLYIANNCRNSKSSYSNLGHSYYTTSPYTYGSTKAKSILAGSYQFYCNEYEVYYLVRNPCKTLCGKAQCNMVNRRAKCYCDVGTFNSATKTCQTPIHTSNFRGSSVLKDQSKETRQKLLHILEEIAPKGMWYKCYRGSENGFSSTAFHQKCDNKGETVTIARVGNNIFGGYTNIPWNGNAGYKRSDKSMLFNVKNYLRYKSTKYPQYATYSNNGYGPTFGAGHDLYIANNCRNSKSSYSNLGHSYRTSSPYTYGSTRAKSALAGSYQFYVNEYEVYYLVRDPCKTTCGNAYCELVNRKPKCSCANGNTFNYAIKKCQAPIISGNFLKSKVMADYTKYRQSLLHILNGVAPNGYWYKCYTGSESGFSSATFHSKCDNKGPTVTLLRSGDHLFGGYSSQSWNANKGYIRSNNNILFSINKYKIFKSTKYPQYGSYSNNGYGPTFGGGHDLYIANNCRNSKSSYSNLGHSYYTTSPYTYGSVKAKSILAGSYNFYVNEYEVYYLIKNPCKTICGKAQCNMVKRRAKCYCDTGYFNKATKSCQQRIYSDNFKDSKVLANRGESTRQSLLHIVKSLKSGGSWKKCYTASENGYQSASFHTNCDNKGTTVIIARAGDHIFGGYTPIDWNGNQGYIRTDKAALFSINKYYIVRSTKYPQYAIYSNRGYGPTFGAGNDLYIPNRCNVVKGYSNLGHSYRTASPYTYGSVAAKSILTGSYQFFTNEYEVYYWVNSN